MPILTLLLLIQAAAGPTTAQPSRCKPSEQDGEVVVCARSGESPHRLKPLPPVPGDPPRDPLAFALPGGGQGRVYAFERRISDVPSRGLAVKAVFPIGRKPKPTE